MKSTVLVVIVLSVASALIESSACTQSDSEAKLEVSIPPREDKTHTLTAQHHTKVIQLLGTIHAFQTTMVVPKAQGHVVELNVDKGDYVNKGDVLLVLDSSDYDLGVRQARAQLRVAEVARRQADTNLANVKREYDRFKELLDKKAIPKSQFDPISDGFEMAEVGLELADAQRDLAEVGLAFAHKRQRDTLVRAPFDGLISERLVSEGSFVQSMPPTTVAVIQQIDPIYVIASLSEMDLDVARPGTSAELVVASLNITTSAEIDKVLGSVDPVTRTIPIRFKLDNAQHRLLPGMSVELTLKSEQEPTLEIPTEFVRKEGSNKAFVYRVASNGSREKIAITITREDDIHTVVESGLREGDVIIYVDPSEDVELHIEKTAEKRERPTP